MIWDVVHDSREAFLACLWAQCSPGAVQGPLPPAGLSADPWLDGGAAILLALLDPGIGLAVAAQDPEAQVVGEELRRRTGAGITPIEEASFVLVGSGAPLGVAAAARRGSPLAPERGATIVYCAPPTPRTVALRGPGVDGVVTTALPLARHELDALTLANGAPPCGVDAFVLVEPDGVLALPRSVRIQVVD